MLEQSEHARTAAEGGLREREVLRKGDVGADG